jgi:hypothetical protein
MEVVLSISNAASMELPSSQHIDQLDGPVSDRIELLRQDCPAAWHIAEALTLPFPALVIASHMYVKAHIRTELEEQVLDLRVGRGDAPVR